MYPVYIESVSINLNQSTQSYNIAHIRGSNLKYDSHTQWNFLSINDLKINEIFITAHINMFSTCTIAIYRKHVYRQPSTTARCKYNWFLQYDSLTVCIQHITFPKNRQFLCTLNTGVEKLLFPFYVCYVYILYAVIYISLCVRRLWEIFFCYLLKVI